jgi:predicted Zn finger-like uncharacterized protein
VGETHGPEEIRKLMFTRCSNCRTVFHITAAELRAADGAAICGACGTTFDALESLSETLPADLTASAPQGPAEASADASTEAAFEAGDSARDEDEFLEELESLIGDDPDAGAGEMRAGDEEYSGVFGPGDYPPMQASAAPLRDDELPSELSTSESAAEAGGPEEEFLVQEFGEGLADEEPAKRAAGGDAAGEPPPGGMTRAVQLYRPTFVDDFDDERDDDIPDPDSVFRIDEPVEDEETPEPEPFVGEGPGEREKPGASPDDDREDIAPGRRGEPMFEADVAEPEDDAEAMPEFAREASGGRGWIRLLLALAAVLVLAGTWAHSQHGKLLRHPTGAAVLGPVYRLLGIDAAPDWNPAEFRAVQWEAIADPAQPDNLTVAVDFMNMASYAQPYPVIRIVLEDRFGRRVGVHDILPEQYLQSQPAGSRLPAGSRVRTTVVVRDPGARADGFRVDFCLDVQGRGLVCGPEPFR